MNIEPILLPRVKLEEFLSKHKLNLVVKEKRDGWFKAEIESVGHDFTYHTISTWWSCYAFGDSPSAAVERLCSEASGRNLQVIRKIHRPWWAFWRCGYGATDIGCMVIEP